MFSDVTPTLLIDISLDDIPMPACGPEDGEWVAFFHGPDGYEAEFTVDRPDDDEYEDAELLAEAVSSTLVDTLRGWPRVPLAPRRSTRPRRPDLARETRGRRPPDLKPASDLRGVLLSQPGVSALG